MVYIGYIIDKLLRNHIHKIIVIHWINYQCFEQPGPDMKSVWRPLNVSTWSSTVQLITRYLVNTVKVCF